MQYDGHRRIIVEIHQNKKKKPQLDFWSSLGSHLPQTPALSEKCDAAVQIPR